MTMVISVPCAMVVCIPHDYMWEIPLSPCGAMVVCHAHGYKYVKSLLHYVPYGVVVCSTHDYVCVVSFPRQTSCAVVVCHANDYVCGITPTLYLLCHGIHLVVIYRK